MKRLLALSLLLSVACFAACVTDMDFSEPDEMGFTVDKAKEWFYQNAEGLNLPAQLVPPADDGTRNGALPDLVLTPHWRQAESYKVGNVEIVDAPVLMNAKMIMRRFDVAAGESQPLYRPSTECRLIQWRENGGPVRMFVMTLIPDNSVGRLEDVNSLFFHPDNNFSGLAFFSELDGTFITILGYKKGEPVQLLDVTPYTKESNTLSDQIILQTSLCLPTGTRTRGLSEYDGNSWSGGSLGSVTVTGSSGSSGSGSGGAFMFPDNPRVGFTFPPHILALIYEAYRKAAENNRPKILKNVSLKDVKKAWRWGQGNPPLYDCLKYCIKTLEEYGITDPGSRSNIYRLTFDNNGRLENWGNNPAQNYKNGIDCINNHLDNNRPIIVGIDYGPTDLGENGMPINEGTTDHFVVVYGREYNSSTGNYEYLYYENGVRNINKCNSSGNRLIYNPSGPEFYDATPVLDKEKRYDVTQIRPNDGKTYPNTTSY